MSYQIRLHGAEDSFGGLASAAHLAQADDAVVGLDFYDGSNEAAPVTSVGMTQWRLKRHCNGGRANVADLHLALLVALVGLTQ